MLMLTLVFIHILPHITAEILTKNLDTPTKPFRNTTGVLQTYALLPPDRHTLTESNASIDAVETNR